MTTYNKKRVVEKLTNNQISQNLTGINRRINVETSKAAQLLNNLNKSQTDYDITPNQFKIIEDEINNGKLTGDESFLQQNALYSDGSRQNNTTAFQYTVKALERFYGNKAVENMLRFYGIKDGSTEYLYKSAKKMSAREIIEKTKQIVDGIPSYQTIRTAIDDMDRALGKSKESEKDKQNRDWSKLRTDVERLAARIYELSNNERYADIFKQNENITDIETLRMGAEASLENTSSPNYMQFPEDFKKSVNAKITKAENNAIKKGDRFSINDLSAQEIVNMLGETQQQQDKPKKQRRKGIVYQNPDGSYTDAKGNPVQIVVGTPPQPQTDTATQGGE